MFINVIINVFCTLIGVIFGYYLDKKQYKLNYQRQKRDELYKDFIDLILDVRDKTSIYFDPVNMLYINYTEGAEYEHNLSQIYNNSLHNEILSLNHKLEQKIVHYGSYFNIESYDFNIVDNQIYSIHHVEVMLDRFISNLGQPKDLIEISEIIEQLKQQNSQISLMFFDMYESVKRIYKADQN